MGDLDVLEEPGEPIGPGAEREERHRQQQRRGERGQANRPGQPGNGLTETGETIGSGCVDERQSQFEAAWVGGRPIWVGGYPACGPC